MLSNFTSNLQSKFANISFKTKAISVAVSLSLLPVIGVGGLAYLVSQNNLRTTEKADQQSLMVGLEAALSRFIVLRGKDMQTLVDLPLFKDAKIFQSQTPAQKDKFLNDYIDRYKFYDSLMVIDVNGNVISASKNSNRENHADREYFQAALKTGKSYISKISTSKTSKQVAIYIAAPVRDSITGNIVAIVRARMPVNALATIAADYGGNDNEWHVIDKTTNKFVLAAEVEDVGLGVNTIFPSYDRLKDSDKPATVIDENSATETDHKRHLVTFINITEGRDLVPLNLSVAVAKKMSVIEAKENAILYVILIGVLVAGSTTLGLSLLLGNRVTKFIQQLADSIVNSSEAIVETVESQEVTVNMQANSAIDTSKTVNELGAISFQSAAQAEASANGARQALSLSEDGTRSVQQTLQGMNGLREKVDAIANQIVNLSEQTGQITIVSDLVADLASQTNMLALNAAVEAARAGEQGRGFSVVADEIRKLADQSKKSADKINALAEDIQTAINRTVMVTDEGTKTVNEGIDLARSTAVTFAGVTDAVNNVFLNSQQISTSAKQQAVSIQQVLSSMTMISQGSQESAVGMHQVKMTTRELNQVADELKAAVV
ncbi:methyl-accepting chemotaxis protein [Chamaesiphon sp. VAR_48_metabat_403]|uniref:methyl-accepting chemotaxis protein n=1 Tax=Chamaesiphon sp. VAR_48_metabat_403 TaxID=2964700 RepID=UPI00286E3F7A|nr:methyl-accepting chemotaxis protein [Chamaesiphon sp. VAR_48_metabat_403]